VTVIRHIIVLLFSYVAAAPLTVHISMNLSETHWDNLWTYFFWATSWLIWAAISTLAVVLFTLIVRGLSR
jgi:hypothetical protein